MRIEKVSVKGFGPFDDDELELAEGLTVVHGPNECGKSSWHAAIYAALCGRRRGKGAATLEDRRFREQRKPWSGGPWKARCVVQLGDGRRFEVSQDLDGKVECDAMELSVGRRVGNGIISDGSPDGSRWLGLNRRSFAATAWVQQADLLGVVDSADELQSALQRAAASGGHDETAAGALRAIEAFQAEHVGIDRVKATKPLRRALVACDRAEGALAAARDSHAQYLQTLAEADRAHQAAAEAARARAADEQACATAEDLLNAVERAGDAHAEASRAAARAEERAAAAAAAAKLVAEAEPLAADVGDFRPPTTVGDDERGRAVAAALASWQALRPAADPGVPAEDALLRQIAGLPDPPVGDIRVDERVRALHDAYTQADAVARAARQRAAEAPGPAIREQQREVALSARDEAAHAVAAAEEAEHLAADAARAVPRPPRPARPGERFEPLRLLSAAGILLALGGVLAVVLGAPVPGVLGVLVGGLVTGGAMLARQRRAARPVPVTNKPAGDSPTTADDRVTEARERLRRGRATLAEAERALTEADHAIADAQALADDANHRDALAARAAAEVRDAVSARMALANGPGQGAAGSERGVGGGIPETALEADPLAAYARYEADCATRADLADRAARRPALELMLQRRREADLTERARAAAARSLSEAAALAGVTAAGDPGQTASALQQWQHDHAERLRAEDSRRAEFDRLQVLLGGQALEVHRARLRDLADQAASADMARVEAERAASAAQHRVGELASAAGVSAPLSREDTEAHRSAALAKVEASRLAEAELSNAAAEVDGRLREQARGVPSVAEAEERLVDADEELQRVRSLAEVLDVTRDFLRKAQDRVNHDIAPVLVATLERWLPQVTMGRYRRAAVDPLTLGVRVAAADGDWFDAQRLSVGTREQVYLLLRLALAEHLAEGDEVCPLLLDDVTVQADAERTDAILAMCKAVADGGRQVVLFAQEPAVAEWAEKHLDDGSGRHALVRLAPISTVG